MNLLTLSPIVGLPQTGFTSPQVDLAADVDPARATKQWYVSAVSGMPGVSPHSTEKPFTIMLRQPQVTAVLGQAKVSGSGYYTRVKTNKYTMITRITGEIDPVTLQRQFLFANTTFELPAGVAIRDSAACKALISVHCGALVEIAPLAVASWASGAWIQ